MQETQSKVYDPTRTILENTYPPKVFKYKSSTPSSVRDKLLPKELVKLQKGIDQSLVPLPTDLFPVSNPRVQTEKP